MSTKRRRCKILDCNNWVTTCPGLGVCHACYQSLRYWIRKRSVKAIIERQRKLAMYQSRMMSLMKGSNISVVTQRRRRKA